MYSARYYSIFLLIFLFFLSQTLVGQEGKLRFERITEKDGLSHAFCKTMVQDSTGFLWFATFRGLDRYDGKTIRAFMYDPRNEHSLPDNNVRTLFIDSKKRLLVGTDKGLSVYDPRTCAIHPLTVNGKPVLPPGTPVMCMKEDRSGNLWTGSKEGLWRISLKTGQATQFLSSPSDTHSLSSHRIRALLVDSRNTLWVGTNRGVNRFDATSGRFIRYMSDGSKREPIHHNLITSLFEDKQGRIWVGTNGGGFEVYLREQNRFKQYNNDVQKNKNPYNLISNCILCLYEDHEGNFWVGSENGLMLFDRERERITTFQHDPLDEYSLLDNIVMTVTEDRSQNLWVTTTAGVSKRIRMPKGFGFIYDSSHSADYPNLNNIYEIVVSHDGNLLLGTRDAGFRSYSPATGSFIQYPADYNKEHALTSKLAWSVLEDRDSTVWIGTGWGLNYRTVRGTTFNRYDPNDPSYPLPGSNVLYSIQDHGGTIWFGTENGVAAYHPVTKQWKRWKESAQGNERLAGKYVDCLFEDSKNRLWLILDNRLFLFDRSTNAFVEYSQHVNRLLPFPVHEFLILTESRTGTLLFGTDFGLLEVNLQSSIATLLTKEHGLPDNVVVSVVEDNNGNVWASTFKGVAFWDRRSNSIFTFNEESGLDNTSFSPGTVCKAKDGTLYFGTMNGIISVHPSEVSMNQNKPNVVFTSYRVFNKEVVLDPDIAVRDRLDIQYTDYLIAFDIAALEFTAPRKNQFAYKLEGFDRTWIDNGNERVITYANLAPGNYTLRVKATNNDGIWNEQGASLEITIIPPFWRTWWFLTLSILLIGGTASGLLRSRYVHLNRAKQEREAFSHRLMERTEEERKRISSELHDSIGQQLLIIKNTSDLGSMKSKTLEDSQKRFQDISTLSETTVKQLREISYNLRPAEIDRFGVWQAIQSLVQRVEETTSLRMVVDFEPVDAELTKETEMHIFRIVQESMNNIIKHSRATEVTIRMVRKEASLHLMISDDGKGFTQRSRRGLGFTSMEARASAIQAHLSIESSPEKGTRLQLIIPVAARGQKL